MNKKIEPSILAEKMNDELLSLRCEHATAIIEKYQNMGDKIKILKEDIRQAELALGIYMQWAVKGEENGK